MTQEVTFTKYKSFDGKVHDTRKASDDWERQNFHLRLIGLSASDVHSAVVLDASADSITAAIELAALEIKRNRRNKVDTTPVPPAAPPAEDPREV